MNLVARETHRIQLDEISWIEHIPGWLGLHNSEQIPARLIASAAWEQRDRWMVNRRVLGPCACRESRPRL